MIPADLLNRASNVFPVLVDARNAAFKFGRTGEMDNALLSGGKDFGFESQVRRHLLNFNRPSSTFHVILFNRTKLYRFSTCNKPSQQQAQRTLDVAPRVS